MCLCIKTSLFVPLYHTTWKITILLLWVRLLYMVPTGI